MMTTFQTNIWSFWKGSFINQVSISFQNYFMLIVKYWIKNVIKSLAHLCDGASLRWNLLQEFPDTSHEYSLDKKNTTQTWGIKKMYQFAFFHNHSLNWVLSKVFHRRENFLPQIYENASGNFLFTRKNVSRKWIRDMNF